MIFTYFISMSFPNHMTSLVLQDLGASRSLIGLAYMLAALPEVPLFILMERLMARFGLYRLIVVCIGVSIFRWLVTGYATSFWPIVLVMPTQSVTFGVFYLCTVKYMNYKTPLELKSSGQSVLAMTLFGISFVVSHQGGGLLADAIGLRNVYPIAALICAASGILLFMLYKKDPRPEMSKE